MIQVHAETSWKIWTGVGLLGLVLVYLATFSAGSLVQKPESEGAVSYSYQMPRVEPVEMPFDLSGRPVNRHVVGQTPTTDEVSPTENSTLTAAKPLKASMVNGKVTGKQAAADKAKAKALKVKTSAAAKIKAQNQARKKQFEVQVLQQRQKAFQSSAEIETKDLNPISATGMALGSTPQNEQPQEDAEKEEDKDISLSAAQWRTLLQVTPSAGNVGKLVRALGKKKIDLGSYYQITKELLRDSAVDRRKAGMMLLSSVPTVATYEFMVTQSGEMSPEVQKDLQREIAKYSQASLLPTTSRVISTSKDTAVISSALGNITTALDNFKKQPAAGMISSQGGSKPPVGVTAQSLAQFITGLNALSASEDPSLAAQAKNLSLSIQEIKK